MQLIHFKMRNPYNFHTHRIDEVLTLRGEVVSWDLGIRPAVLFNGCYVLSKYGESLPSFCAVKFSLICIVTAGIGISIISSLFTGREEI